MINIKWGATAAIIALSISVILGLLFGVGASYIIMRGFIFAAVFFGIGFGLRFVISRFFPEIFYTGNETGAPDNELPGAKINITLDSAGEYAVPELYRVPDSSDGIGNINDLISGVLKTSKPADEQKTGAKLTDQWYDIQDPIDGVFPEAIDRMKKNSYNGIEGGRSDLFQETNVFESFSSAVSEASRGTQPAETPVFKETQFSPSFDDDSELGGLPDLDMMAMAFSSAPGAALAPPVSSSAPVSSAPSVSPVPPISSAPSMSPFFLDDDADAVQNRDTDNKSQPLEGDFNPKDMARGISTLLSKN